MWMPWIYLYTATKTKPDWKVGKKIDHLVSVINFSPHSSQPKNTLFSRLWPTWYIGNSRVVIRTKVSKRRFKSHKCQSILFVYYLFPLHIRLYAICRMHSQDTSTTCANCCCIVLLLFVVTNFKTSLATCHKPGAVQIWRHLWLT